MYHPIINEVGIFLESDNGTATALRLPQLSPFRLAPDGTTRPSSNWDHLATEACPTASRPQIQSLAALGQAPIGTASDLATALVTQMRLTLQLDGAIHGRFRRAHVTYSPGRHEWTAMETGVTASTLAGLLQVAYGRTPRTRSPLILELPRCGAHRTVLQLTEHDLTIFRQIAAEIESPELSTAFPTWKKAGITDPQLSLLRSLFVAIDGVVPYEYLAASGDPIVVPPDGDFRVEWVDRLSAPFLWLDLQQSDVCTEITPDGSGRMVYAYGDHLIPFSLLEEADLFPNLDQMAAWLNEPCAALHYRVPRFLLEESVHSLPQIRSAMRQARRNPGNSEQNTVTVQATY